MATADVSNNEISEITEGNSQIVILNEKDDLILPTILITQIWK